MLSSSPAMAREVSWVTSKARQRLLVLKAVTAQVRLANNAIKASPGFSIFGPGDLQTINLEDFPPSATVYCIRYTLTAVPLVFHALLITPSYYI